MAAEKDLVVEILGTALAVGMIAKDLCAWMYTSTRCFILFDFSVRHGFPATSPLLSAKASRMNLFLFSFNNLQCSLWKVDLHVEKVVTISR